MILSIDPGLRTTAWVLWSKRLPYRIGMVHTSPKESLPTRCHKICHALRNDLKPATRIGIEYPRFHPGSAGGMMVAGRGDLVKLTFTVGWLSCHAFCTGIIELVPVMKWKGQLPKRVTQGLVKRVLGEKACKGFKADIWDAAGIGLYMIHGERWWEK